MQRLELSANNTVGKLTTSLLYARQEAQPDLGYVRRREGLQIANSLALPNNWSVNGNVLFDLDRYIQDRDLVAADPSLASTRYRDTPFRVAAYGLGVAYADECTIFSVQYTRSVSDAVGSQKLASNTILFRLELKHLGQVNYRVASGAAATPDQIR